MSREQTLSSVPWTLGKTNIVAGQRAGVGGDSLGMTGRGAPAGLGTGASAAPVVRSPSTANETFSTELSTGCVPRRPDHETIRPQRDWFLIRLVSSVTWL